MSQFSHPRKLKKIIKPSFIHSAKMVIAKCGTRFNSKDVKQFPAAEFLLCLAMLQSEIVYENAHDGQMSCFEYHNVFSNSLMLISILPAEWRAVFKISNDERGYTTESSFDVLYITCHV